MIMTLNKEGCMKDVLGNAARVLLAAAVIVSVTLSATAPVQAQSYPTRDITFIVPFAPGGSADPLGRQFTKQLEKVLGVNVNVENKAGGSATIGVNAVVRARPDGYTVGMGSNSSMCYQPLVLKGLAYKTPDDFQPIVKLIHQPVLLAVRSDAPWKTFEDFMKDVRKQPGKLRVAVSGLKTLPDLVIQQLNQVANVKITTVPFTGGGGESALALLGGRVEGISSHAATVLGHVQAGTMRVLTVFQKGKYEPFPDVTPVYEAGYDATLSSMYAFIGPKGMPKNVLDKLVSSSFQVLRTDEFKKFCNANGFDLQFKGPAELRAELIEHGRIFADLMKQK
jgi:tripartite-type tricarboxylate transporter receptor subunit TctC